MNSESSTLLWRIKEWEIGNEERKDRDKEGPWMRIEGAQKRVG